MKKMKFNEYMNSRGKIEKPVVDASADRTDPMTPPNTPPQKGKPYAVSDGKTKKTSKEKGFGDMGEKDLKYEPETESGKKGKAPAKIPTCEQVELATLVVDTIVQDPAMMEQLVSRMKQCGLLGQLVAEVMDHRASYNYLADIMTHESHGPKACDRLARALTEEVAQPFAAQLDDEEEEDEDEEMGDDLENSDQADGEGIDGEEPNVSLENPDMNVDPTMGGQMAMDPNMMPPGGPMPPGIDPMSTPMPVDPLMSGAPMSPAMMNFQRAFQRAYQRAMMRKN